MFDFVQVKMAREANQGHRMKLLTGQDKDGDPSEEEGSTHVRKEVKKTRTTTRVGKKLRKV